MPKLSAIIDALVATGASGEQVAAVVHVFEAEAEERRLYERERKRKQRASKAQASVSECPGDNAGQVGTSRNTPAPPSPPSSSPPIPPLITTPSTPSPPCASERAREAVDTVCAAWADWRGGDPPFLAPGDQIQLHKAIERHGLPVILDVVAKARGSPTLSGKGDYLRGGMPLRWLWDDQRIAEVLRGEHNGKLRDESASTDDVRGAIAGAIERQRERRRAGGG